MENNASNETQKPCCSQQKEGFNFCLFSKSIIAFPALCVVAYIPVALFHTPALQVGGAIAATAATIYAAVWIDSLPALQKKIQVFKK